jgi:hypothetical protein
MEDEDIHSGGLSAPHTPSRWISNFPEDSPSRWISNFPGADFKTYQSDESNMLYLFCGTIQLDESIRNANHRS